MKCYRNISQITTSPGAIGFANYFNILLFTTCNPTLIKMCCLVSYYLKLKSKKIYWQHKERSRFRLIVICEVVKLRNFVILKFRKLQEAHFLDKFAIHNMLNAFDSIYSGFQLTKVLGILYKSTRIFSNFKEVFCWKSHRAFGVALTRPPCVAPLWPSVPFW